MHHEHWRHTIQKRYSSILASRNWHVETADWIWPSFLHFFINLRADIGGSFLRFIETGFRNWLAAFLGFSMGFLWCLWLSYDFSRIFNHFSVIAIWFYTNHRKILNCHGLGKSRKNHNTNHMGKSYDFSDFCDFLQFLGICRNSLAGVAVS